MTRKQFQVAVLVLLGGGYAACAHPTPKTPPEPPVTETAPLELAPVHFAPAPVTTLPGPVDPPPEVLHVQDDGRG